MISLPISRSIVCDIHQRGIVISTSKGVSTTAKKSENTIFYIAKSCQYLNDQSTRLKGWISKFPGMERVPFRQINLKSTSCATVKYSTLSDK
jgi:hypothetical protein